MLKDLIAKTEKVLPKGGNWQVFYLGFSCMGWKASALEFTQEFVNQEIGEARWQAARILLRDLDEVDRIWQIGRSSTR